MTFAKRVVSMAAALTALSSIASGYYHFVYFPSRVGPFTPINLQFDLSRLTNNTVYFFISDQGPNIFVPGDTFPAVISELQLAAQAWNNVPGSQIKIAYGGLENAATQQSAPGIDVVFSDQIPYGILAQTKVTTYANVSFINNNTPFLPILRSQIQLQKDLTSTIPQQASSYDSSFTVMAHEFGHSLGLQHTETSACMSTYVTRSTTKSMPLAADDVAGISLLYPAPGYLASTGSISGRVTLNGGGVSLASVVALSPTTGMAISNLTNPDGTYRIDAIPPGNYLLYVHPLPPAQQGEAGPDAIVLPQDATQFSFAANTGFVTQFFPGTRDWAQAATIGVSQSSTLSNVNFNVQGSAGPVIYGMQLSGGVNGAVEASPMLEGNGSFSLEFTAPGTTVGNQLASGLNVSVIGSTSAAAYVVPGYTKWYTLYQGKPYVSMAVYTSAVQSTTPVALAVTVNNDLYVLPAAFYVVPSGPPTLTNLIQGTDQFGNGTLTVYGSSLSQATQIVFDGALATVLNSNGDGSITVAAPPAPGPYSSSIEALNPDGQTSGQAIPFATPPPYLYQYGYANPAQIQVSPPSLLPGTDTMVQINGNNTNFNSQTTVGFGSSDIVVKQIFVIGPGLLQVNVSVNQGAPPTATTVTVTTGLQTATQTLFMQVLAPNPSQITLHAPVTSALTGLAGVPAGGTALIYATGIPQNLTGWTLTIGQQQVTPMLVNGVLQVVVPNGLPVGPAIVQLTSPSGTTIPPIVMKIDAPAPVIISVTSLSGNTISSNQPAHPGDVLILTVAGLSDGFTPITVPNTFASLGGVIGQGGVAVPVLQVNSAQVEIQLPLSIPTGTSLPIYLGIGTRLSPAFSLNIHN